MSIPSKLATAMQDVAGLLFPRVCASCGKPLAEGGRFLCNYCRWEIPLTRFWEKAGNPVEEKLGGHMPLVGASSFYYFVHDSGFRDLIHRFKYSGNWRAALEMGRWYGAELAASGNHADIDLLLPVPLHLRKRISRGYNQSTYIAEGMAESLAVPVDTRSVRRAVYNRSQTTRRKSDRWQNVEGIFRVRRPEALAGKHILLVDDVLTTGATLISLGETILKAVPDCRISIATLAVSKADLETVRRPIP